MSFNDRKSLGTDLDSLQSKLGSLNTACKALDLGPSLLILSKLLKLAPDPYRNDYIRAICQIVKSWGLNSL